MTSCVQSSVYSRVCRCYVYIAMCIYIFEHVCMWRPEVNLGEFPQELSLFLKNGSLNQDWGSTIKLVWLISEP